MGPPAPMARFHPSVNATQHLPGGSGSGVIGGHYSSSLLGGGAGNKFNTIHSSKRPLPSINHYESAAEAKLGSGKDPAYYARGRDNVNSYHMSTLGRSSSMRAKDPLLSTGPVSRGGVGNTTLGEVGGSSSNGSSSNDNSSNGKGQQVVDSAYGTTRSVKNKVYL